MRGVARLVSIFIFFDAAILELIQDQFCSFMPLVPLNI